MIVDLSVVGDASTLGPPAAGSPPVDLQTAFRGPGHWQPSRIATLLHTGTHVDAPIHVVAGGRPIEAIAIDELSGPCVVIDVQDATDREPIDAARLEAAAPRSPPARSSRSARTGRIGVGGRSRTTTRHRRS